MVLFGRRKEGGGRHSPRLHRHLPELGSFLPLFGKETTFEGGGGDMALPDWREKLPNWCVSSSEQAIDSEAGRAWPSAWRTPPSRRGMKA